MNINYPLLIDGGLSNQLESQGCDLNHRLWSARLLDSKPEAIKQAHLAYLESGAQCIITSSYQASIPGFMTLGHDRATAETLILKSVKLAEEAIKDFRVSHPNSYPPLVAASIGPYGAYMADSSEYRGHYGLSDEELTEFHQPRIELLDTSGADFFACETMPSFQEAKVLAEILKHTKKPAWVSFSCKDERHLNDGTPLEDCAAFFASHPGVFAIGVNCTAPHYISPLIRAIKGKSGDKKVVVYPNSGEIYHAASKTWSGSSDLSFFQLMANEWLDLGADIIGGCCRMGPEYIKSIAQVINRRL
ncbi:MAG: homocysteine S-methyltransferase [Anaerolineales bacterium]